MISLGNYFWGDAPQKDGCVTPQGVFPSDSAGDEGYFSHDKQELRYPETGNHCFGAAQASTRTWEGAHVHTEWRCTVHHPGTHGERLCWSKQSHFVSLTTASTSVLGNASIGR